MMGEKKNQGKTVGVLPNVGQTGRAESERTAAGCRRHKSERNR